MKTYIHYDDIPVVMKEYVLSVSGAKSIYEIDIWDINVFLSEMEEYCDTKPIIFPQSEEVSA